MAPYSRESTVPRLRHRFILSISALFAACIFAASAIQAQTPHSSSPESARWKAHSAAVTILRDDWGIAHITGTTDADAVFGMIYAQAEDDFPRIEANYLTALGRTAEAEGESALWQDLRQRLFIDPAELQRLYTQSPLWLRKLMDAWADGLNFYLATHPETHPRVLTRFEPWMALSFTEGSIGGDIERVNLKQLEAFYSTPNPTTAQLSPLDVQLQEQARLEREPSGSNGIAIAPANTINHHALLLINPHTSFFFRSELQMKSSEGLNAYGAVTWGQFFIYQGFNERAGWMHTSSNVDAVDQFAEDVYPIAGKALWMVRYGKETRPMLTKPVTIRYKTATGTAERTFITYATTHGPIIRKDGDKWISIALMNIPIPALQQSYLRTKARSYAEYSKTMELQANSSNNTIFADADGDIAYWHGNFIPRRDPHIDYKSVVDGSNPAADWHGLLTLAETPQLHNPASGFLFNVNNWPWAGAGTSSLKRSDFPPYVERTTAETARGYHAIRVLTEGGAPRKDFTLEGLLAAAFDGYLPWFDKPLPALLKAYDALPTDSPIKSKLAAQIHLLRPWNQRWVKDPASPASIPTTLAVFWGEELRRTLSAGAREANLPVEEFAAQPENAAALLQALDAASAKLTADFGTWQTPWGTVNRFQRTTADIVQPFNDALPSIPVPFVSSVWGSLASFGAHAYPGTKKWYGTSGNSFVAVVEFGPRVHARAITAGGESGHPTSPHFDDEAQRYASGNLREVYFYPDQLTHHAEKTYHPGGN
jgi:acyl-homoserine lactone acylase PvdQ